VKPGDLKRFPLLVEFDDEDRAGLSQLLEPLPLAEGEEVFCEGDEADALFLVVRGRIRISTKNCEELGMLSGGSSLGSMSLMTIGTREATARADSDCELMVLTRADFRRLVDDAPRTACRLAEAVVAQLASGLRPQLARIEREFRVIDSTDAG
jgi:CRP-like cAMP-binding protein